MIWYVHARTECILAAVRAYHKAPHHCPLILMANMRRANRHQYTPEELDDLISDGVAHELWGLVQRCQINWSDHPHDYYYDVRGGHRAIYLDVYFRPGTLEWQRAEEELAPELKAEGKKRGVHYFG